MILIFLTMCCVVDYTKETLLKFKKYSVLMNVFKNCLLTIGLLIQDVGL